MSADVRWLVISSGRFLASSDGILFHSVPPASYRASLLVNGLVTATSNSVACSAANDHIYVAILDEPLPDGIALRSLIYETQPDEFSLLARASQLEHWWKSHQFCGACAAPTQLNAQEMALHCTNCDALYYPRISPCIIVLIRKGNQCLLAEHTRSTAGRYSTLAGFIEVGESAEEALAREVYEEVGIRVRNIEYVTSQNWPFPSQLMLGFFADYHDGVITVDGDEITDAKWFTNNSLPEVPPQGTIARHLIDAFFETQS